ncbi:UNVERIFIED_CONTAM: hypothetical protein Sangu_1545300 [Sesamum angustifolium]|uniref:Secreted protein n=1 Tax=Sesamum angustifolium TaxID=2727405 RepID=A0AAW2MTS5_9LAMI
MAIVSIGARERRCIAANLARFVVAASTGSATSSASAVRRTHDEAAQQWLVRCLVILLSRTHLSLSAHMPEYFV